MSKKETDPRLIRRLFNAIIGNRFNAEKYGGGGTWYGMTIQTQELFASYGQIGFTVWSPYSESFDIEISYDWEMKELTIDDIDWKQWFIVNHFPWNEIKSDKSISTENVREQILAKLRDAGLETAWDDWEAGEKLGTKDSETTEYDKYSFVCESMGDERAPGFHPFEWYDFQIKSEKAGGKEIFYIEI